MVDSRCTNSSPARDFAAPTDAMADLETVNERLRSGDDSAVADLIRILEQGVHFFLRRANGNQSSDRHNQETVLRIALATAERAQRGQFPNSRAICRHVLSSIRAASAAQASRVSSINRQPFKEPAVGFEVCLTGLSDLDREAVRRYYLLRQEPEEICEDLDIERQYLDEILSRLRQRAVRAQAPARVVRTRSIGA